MGGVAGGMAHLYNDPSLTFNDIKKILSAASRGEIEGTEKTDGYNIYLGYVNGKARAARNKGDMAKGGMDFGTLAAREFKGGPEVRKVYLDAFRAYSMALDTLSEKELDAIFGENGEVFYNTEIQGPSASNVVNYDANVLSIHPTGHKKYNKETNQLELVDTANNSAALDKVIDRFEEKLQDEDFKVRRTAVLKLNKLDSDYDLNIALNKMEKAGFSGDMTIGEYLEANILEYLNQKLAYLSDDVKQAVVDRILRKPGALGIPQITKGMPKTEKQKISAFIKYGPALLKKYTYPLEDAIHDFSVELLRGLQSAYILDNEAQVEKLKKEVADAIKTLRDYSGPGAEQAHEILFQQLKKLKHHDNVNTAVEGFVFQIGDQVYKFTGNFAPVNQLLGLFRYGRGKVPALKGQELNEVEKHFNYPSNADVGPVVNEPSNPEDKKYLIIIPGGFKPPHLGHYNLVKSYLDHPSVERVAIVIGDSERTDSEERISIGFDEAVRTWKEYGISEGPNVTFIRARKRQNKKGEDYENPMADAYDLIQEIDPNELKEGNMVVAMGASTKGGDYERAVKFAKSHQPGSRYYREGVIVTEPPVKVRAEDFSYPEGSKHAGMPISATHMRQAIADGDLKEFSYHVPEVARKSEKALKNLMNNLAGRDTYEPQERPDYDEGTTATPPLNPAALDKIGEGLDIFNLLQKVIEENMDVDDALEELSSGGAGSAATGPVSKKRNKRVATMFREEEELEEDAGVRGQPGSNYPSARDADDRTNEVDPETGKSGNVGPKYKIAREQSEIEEIANYLLEAGVFIG
jgi:phosphopantetheine adenylyltransferase